MYRVVFRRIAKKSLDSLPKAIGDRITLAIAGLRQVPRPPGCRKVVGSEDGFRIRVGRYRIIYEVRDKQRLVVIMKVVLRAERSYRGV
jgi:mRNA interferase RelE/StbE